MNCWLKTESLLKQRNLEIMKILLYRIKFKKTIDIILPEIAKKADMQYKN